MCVAVAVRVTELVTDSLCTCSQHFRFLEERKRMIKEGGAHLSDTLPRKKPTPTPQFSCSTLGRSYPAKVHTLTLTYILANTHACSNALTYRNIAVNGRKY